MKERKLTQLILNRSPFRGEATTRPRHAAVDEFYNFMRCDFGRHSPIAPIEMSPELTVSIKLSLGRAEMSFTRRGLLMDRYHACWQQDCHETAWREAEQDYFARVLIDKPEHDRGYDYKNAAPPVPWLAAIIIDGHARAGQKQNRTPPRVLSLSQDSNFAQ